MKRKSDAVGLAFQIVTDYPDWGDEHVSDMIQTYDRGEAPCTGDELLDLCYKVEKLVKEGKGYDAVMTALVGKPKRKHRKLLHCEKCGDEIDPDKDEFGDVKGAIVCATCLGWYEDNDYNAVVGGDDD